jgi:hypothetical protein
MIGSATLPAGQRAYYEQMLLDTLRTKSILTPFCAVKEDFRARDTGQLVYTEVMDTEPNWNAGSETAPWLSGAYLDSRSLTIGLEIHNDVIKISEYNELVNFWNNGDLTGLVQGKLGQNMVDHLDHLALNAFLSHPNKLYGGDATSRATLATGDNFLVDMTELIRLQLEENEVPGVASANPDDVGAIVCVTTAGVIHDIRTASGSKWIEAQNYVGSTRRFTGEVGSWNGVRFVKTQRAKLRNHGTAVTQTTLTGATVPGQGAAATVDVVWSVGQSGSTRTIPVTSSAGFAVGQYVTIHNLGVGVVVKETDGTQETRRIVAVGSGTLSLDKPLLKAHASGDYVTNALDVHASIFMGGPGVVYGVGERPHPFPLPVIDDAGMIRRFAWRGFLKYQLFRPEMFGVIETTASR